MQEYKKKFIKFMMENEVLLFGEFTLKSGRKAPILSIPENTERARRSPASANITRNVIWRTG